MTHTQDSGTKHKFLEHVSWSIAQVFFCYQKLALNRT